MMPYPTYEYDCNVELDGRDYHLEHGIRVRAYELWEAAGRPAGNDAQGHPLAEYFWLKAEAEIAKPVGQRTKNHADFHSNHRQDLAAA